PVERRLSVSRGRSPQSWGDLLDRLGGPRVSATRVVATAPGVDQRARWTAAVRSGATSAHRHRNRPGAVRSWFGDLARGAGAASASGQWTCPAHAGGPPAGRSGGG